MMARLTEEMVIARSKQSDLSAIKKLNCWGAELSDVSLLQRMPNVEVLAFSINKIRTLGEFASCQRLRELYVRKNEIGDLAEIRHLRHLPNLTHLWLEENPCTQHPEYRLTVLRNLPNLEKLDNVAVHAEELHEAMRRGHHIPHDDEEEDQDSQQRDEEEYVQQESYEYGEYPQRPSRDSSPERDNAVYYTPPQQNPPHATRADQGSDSSEGGVESVKPAAGDNARLEHPQCPLSPSRRDSDGRLEHPATHPAHPASAMTRSHYDYRTSSVRSPDDPSLRHSLSAQSVKEYAYSTNGECRYERGSGSGSGGGQQQQPPQQHIHDSYYERPERCESYSGGARCEWERERERERERTEYPSAVMSEHRGFTRRPVTRNSNLLSAVLCLVKELDYPSLEVAEMAVRCRMDELANSQ